MTSRLCIIFLNVWNLKMKFQTLAAVSLATIGSQIGFAASVAQADVLPATYFNQAYYGNFNGFQGTGNPTPGLSVAPFPGVSASTQNNYNIPYLSATATATNNSAAAETSLTYYMQISGPGTNVPITLQASGETSSSSDPGGFGSSTNFLKIFGDIDGGPGLFYNTCSGINCIYSSSFSVDGPHTFRTDSSYTIQMDVSVVALNGSASGWVDPFFGAPSGYTITISEGIGNAPVFASAVPEPATWAMLLLGFAGIGFMAYRRKATPALMAA
jgi:hypothetical protein